MKTKRDKAAAVMPVDDATRASQFEKLRAVMKRVKSQPGMGALTRALSRMLDAGHIVCGRVRRGGKHELVLSAKVTPADISALLPLVIHPVPYSLLRFFLEGIIYIAGLQGDETELQFCNAEEFIKTPDSRLRQRIYGSGVPDPPEVEEAAKRAAAEFAVVGYLEMPFHPNPEGWVDLLIGGQSVEIRCVNGRATPIRYRKQEPCCKDLVVFAALTRPQERPELLGWIPRERLDEVERKSGGAGDEILLDVDALLPMEFLREDAQAGGSSWIQ